MVEDTNAGGTGSAEDAMVVTSEDVAPLSLVPGVEDRLDSGSAAALEAARAEVSAAEAKVAKQQGHLAAAQAGLVAAQANLADLSA